MTTQRYQGGQEVVVDIPLDGGIDVTSEERAVMPPAVVQSKNTRHTVAGTVVRAPSRTAGSTDYATNGDDATVLASAVLDRRVLWLSDRGPYAMSDDTGDAYQVPGTHEATSTAALKAPTTWQPADVATGAQWSVTDPASRVDGSTAALLRSGGYTYVAFCVDVDGTKEGRIAVFDSESGARLASESFSDCDLGTDIYLVPGISDLHLIYATSTGAIKHRSMAFSAPTLTLGSASTLWTMAAASGIVAGADSSGTGRFWVVGKDTTSTQTRLRWYTGSITVRATITTSAQSTFYGACEIAAETVVFVASSSTGTIVLSRASASSGLSISNRLIFSAANWKVCAVVPFAETAAAGSDHVLVAATSGNNFGYTKTALVRTDVSSGGGVAQVFPGTVLCAHPASDGRYPLLALMRNTDESSVVSPVADVSVVLCRAQDSDSSASQHTLVPIARVGADFVDRDLSAGFRFCARIESDEYRSKSFTLPLVGWSQPGIVREVAGDPLYRANGSVTREYAINLAPRQTATINHGSSIYIPSGVTMVYDGAAASPPILWRPAIRLSASAGTGDVLTAGDYSIVAVYTWRDAAGNWHRSAPSAALAFTANGSSKYAFDVLAPPPWCGERSGVEMYMTDAGGSVYYLNVNNDATATWPHPIQPTDKTNDGYWVFEDIRNTDTIQPSLFTTGGIIEPDPPPPALHGCRSKDRVFVIDAESPDRVWASLPVSTGAAIHWTALFAQPFGEPLTAAVDFYGTPMFFSRTAAYILSGEGPDASGAGAFAQPSRVADVGCVNRSTLIATPAGVITQDGRGFFLIRQDMSVVPIGAQVQAVTDSTLTGAILDRSAAEVHFTRPTADGNWLVYNYVADKWSTWGERDAVAAAWRRAQDADSDQGTMPYERVWATSDATPRIQSSRETPNGWSSTEGLMTIETPWIRLQGLSGNCRAIEFIYRAVNLATHGVVISVYYDYADTVARTFTWSSTKVAAATSGQHYELRQAFNSSAHSSIKIKIEEQTSMTDSMRPLGLSIRYIAAPGVRRRFAPEAGQGSAS